MPKLSIVQRRRPALVASLGSLLLLAACGDRSNQGSTSGAVPSLASAASADESAPSQRRACDMVTAKQMSQILGESVTAEPISSDASGKTDCNYAPTSGSSMPMAQLTIEYGSAEAAMAAAGMLGNIEPGIANPYEGLGDQAAAIGPAVWIRKGEDLITIMIMGADAPEAAVRSVYELVTSATP